MARQYLSGAGAAELRRLRRLMCGWDDPGLPDRDERVEGRILVVRVPADLRMPAFALGGLAVMSFPSSGGGRKREGENLDCTTRHLHPRSQTG
jgi:hypothetical protein